MTRLENILFGQLTVLKLMLLVPTPKGFKHCFDTFIATIKLFSYVHFLNNGCSGQLKLLKLNCVFGVCLPYILLFRLFLWDPMHKSVCMKIFRNMFWYFRQTQNMKMTIYIYRYIYLYAYYSCQETGLFHFAISLFVFFLLWESNLKLWCCGEGYLFSSEP